VAAHALARVRIHSAAKGQRAHVVHEAGDRLKVVRVNAASDTAEVIKLQSVWDGPNVQFVADAVSGDVIAPVDAAAN
jgi:hypothetical protein